MLKNSAIKLENLQQNNFFSRYSVRDISYCEIDKAPTRFFLYFGKKLFLQNSSLISMEVLRSNVEQRKSEHKNFINYSMSIRIS